MERQVNNPTNEISKSSNSPSAEAAGSQKTFVEKGEAQLKEWSARIDQLGKEAEKLSAEAKTAMTKQVADLRTKVAAARERLQESKFVTSDKWAETKTGLETLWSDVKALFEKSGPKHAMKRPALMAEVAPASAQGAGVA